MPVDFRITCLPVALACAFVSFGLDSFAQQSVSTQSAADQDKDLCAIAGSVVRASTNEPLTKARIVLKSEDDNSVPPYVAITDSEGKFKIDGIR